MLESENVILRSIEEDDLEQLRKWRNNPALRKYFREYREISRSDQHSWYKNTVLSNQSNFMFAIEDKKSHNLLGACGLCYIDWVRKSTDLSIYIGKDNVYLDEVYAVESSQLLVKYGFEELGLHRIWAEAYSHDLKKQKLFEYLHFNLDGRFRDAHWSDGQWIDSLFYSLLEGEVSDSREH